MSIDQSEIQEEALITEQLEQSVQVFPDMEKGSTTSLMFRTASVFERKSLLGIRGTQKRLERQHAWYHHEDNGMYRSIISGLTKRIQSLPYEISSEDGEIDKWDAIIRYANFDNYENFISQLIINYSVFDTGAFVEIIAPGDPMEAPKQAATGVAILDSRRCYPTGDPVFPVVYYGITGKVHVMHRSRVFQFVDMDERDESLPGWGDSSLSRCMAAIFREVLTTRYMRASLDDMPAPGFALAKNLAEKKIMQQIEVMQKHRDDDQDIFGRLIFLYGADTSQMPELEFLQFQKEFAKFDPQMLSSMNAKYMAAGVGVDVQDFWELSGAGIGTATQSEILNEKSKGRALGTLIKRIERLFNDVFPDGVEFKYKYRNEEEDLLQAQTAQAWATAVTTLEPYLTADESRIIAANQIPSVKDAITDDNGDVIRVGDEDPKTPEQQTPVDAILIGEGGQGISNNAVVSGEGAAELNKLIIDQMNSSMIDVFTAARMLGQNPAEELRGMYWVGNQLVPQNQLQNIWKYGTLIAPSTTNADLIVESEPSALPTGEDAVSEIPSVPINTDNVSIEGAEASTEEETPAANFATGEEKDYRRTAKRFREMFNTLIKALKNGDIAPGSVNVLLMDEFAKAGRFAYLDGMKRTGMRKPVFDDKGKKELALWVSRQRPLIRKFTSDVVSGEYSDKELQSKGMIWANGSLSDMLWKGMESNAKKLWQWFINPIKEHCRSCLRLNGQIHMMKTYVKNGLLPQSMNLICTGLRCGCGLRAVEAGTKPRGRLAGVPKS